MGEGFGDVRKALVMFPSSGSRDLNRRHHHAGARGILPVKLIRLDEIAQGKSGSKKLRGRSQGSETLENTELP